MGFNRRKMDDERRREAEKQAAAKRGLSPEVRADALRFVTWSGTTAEPQRAPLLFLADDRRRHYLPAPVSVGPLSRLLHRA